MVPPPTVSPVTGDSVPSYYIHSSSPHFQDNSGRTLLLRGINLSSSAKTPIGQPGAQLEGFWETGKSGEMSFVGRVLDLEDGKVDEHLERLRSWGFNTFRYVVTWESIEHKGPGQYDQDYLDYTVALLRKCREHGFRVYMDPHQDLFSRFSGGSGAPYWSLIACGLNPENFTTTNAAFIECEWPTPLAPSPADYPAMIWATNYSRLACQTLFTLWAAGKDYAPKCIIDGVNIQDYLQEHYFDAMRQLGKAIADAGDLLDECVIGWDSLNEPNAGYLGIKDLAQHGKESVLRVGPMPTPFEAMRLGMGTAVEVENWKFGPLGPKRDGSVLVDPKGKRAWLDSDYEAEGSVYGWVRGPEWELGTCIWGLHGIWDPELDELIRPDYFDNYRGGEDPDQKERKVDFGADYWLAHWRRWAPVVRGFHPEAIHFIQTPVFQIPPKIEGPELQNRVAHSSHFYDGLTLVTKHWNWFNADALGILRGKYASVVLGVKVGETAIRKCLRDQLGVLRQDTFDALGQYPTMMGEIGIPFDLDHKKAYTDGDYSAQTKALDASLNACDGANALNYSIWNYCPDNSHEWGDLWNGEDLSLWSVNDQRRMHRNRASTSHLDFVGKISQNRSRANSRASVNSVASSQFSSRNPSNTRLEAPNSPSPLFARLYQPLSKTKRESSTPYLIPPTTSNSRAISDVDLLASSTGSVVPPPSSGGTTLNSDSCDPLLPINLNDGARAIAAFCRPYPTKTVGVPLGINFDIRSSTFTLSVRIDANQVPDENLATEIFVPLIHYAAFPSRISQIVKDQEDLSRGSSNSPSRVSTPIQEDNTTSGQTFRRQESGVSLASMLPRMSSMSLLEDKEDPQALALNVKVSAGRWETEGQILKWFCPRPREGSVVVKIEISRAKGPIPAWLQQSGVRSITSRWFEIYGGRTGSDWESRRMYYRVGLGLISVAALVLLVRSSGLVF